MSRSLNDERFLLSPPGDDILEHINFIKMSQSELADRLDKTPSKVNDLIKGKEPITFITAFQLEKVLGIEAKYWLNREMIYREKLARIEQREDIEESKAWAKQHPIKELVKCGYIKPDVSQNDLASELLEFYGVANEDRWQSRYVQEFATADYRRSVQYKTSLASMAAFLRIGEIEMQKLNLPEFDKSKFRKVLHDVKLLVQKQPEDFADQLKEKCASAGVGLVYTMCLPKAPVSGATRWFRTNPLIQLTDRYKTNDRFWFSFYHEAGHVMLHGRKETFIEDFEGFKRIKSKEAEANEFAMNNLLPAEAIDELHHPFSDLAIKKTAKKYDTHPAIIIGRLQYLEEMGYNEGNHFKLPICLFKD